LATRWWWQAIRRRGGSDAAVVGEAWLAAPEHVPEAIEVLASLGVARAVISWLPAAVCGELTARIAESYVMLELGAVLRGRPAATDTAPPRTVVPERALGPELRAELRGSVAPWRGLAPGRGLDVDRELLLGVALVVRRALSYARSARFAASTRAWLSVPAPASAPPREAGAPAGPPPRNTVSAPNARVTPVMGNEPAHRQRTAASRPRSRTERSVPRRPRTPAAARQSGRARTGRAMAPRRPVRGGPAPAATGVPAGTEPQPALAAAALDTELGGVFYLLNLALFLELYPDFTRPLGRGIALDPWDLVTLLARRLLGGGEPRDPLWGLLARLAGRTAGEQPGAGFLPPRAWRTPDAWLSPFDHDGAWLWSGAENALRIAHPGGFLVTAVPRTGAPIDVQLRREVRRLRPLRPAVSRASLPREPRDPVARWIGRLATYADARLRGALGLEPGDDLAGVLLRHRARVFASGTHVDVALSLADLPLSVRYAGLDRDPGWIPAAGRFVALHFA
jgi:hypothetical protein